MAGGGRSGRGHNFRKSDLNIRIGTPGYRCRLHIGSMPVSAEEASAESSHRAVGAVPRAQGFGERITTQLSLRIESSWTF